VSEENAENAGNETRMAKAEPHAVRRFSFTVHSLSAFPALSAFSSLTAR